MNVSVDLINKDSLFIKYVLLGRKYTEPFINSEMDCALFRRLLIGDKKDSIYHYLNTDSTEYINIKNEMDNILNLLFIKNMILT